MWKKISSEEEYKVVRQILRGEMFGRIKAASRFLLAVKNLILFHCPLDGTQFTDAAVFPYPKY